MQRHLTHYQNLPSNKSVSACEFSGWDRLPRVVVEAYRQKRCQTSHLGVKLPNSPTQQFTLCVTHGSRSMQLHTAACTTPTNTVPTHNCTKTHSGVWIVLNARRDNQRQCVCVVLCRKLIPYSINHCFNIPFCLDQVSRICLYATISGLNSDRAWPNKLLVIEKVWVILLLEVIVSGGGG